MPFIDRLRIYVQGGGGGDGCMSFRREKFVPRGGPNGGDGGDGGSVYLYACKDANTFYKLSFHPHWKGERGAHGKGSNMTGWRGADAHVPVPLGTLVYEGNSHALLGELVEDGQALLVAKGGRGGRGNTAFKSNFNKAPRKREFGKPGEEKTLDLELKLLADVGLLGFPNAGKSTLLSRITNAKPKVADYPFTTLSPILGITHWKNRSFTVADIPGLIEGAHEGKGLGDEFLRHVERTKLLVHLVDPLGFSGTAPLKSLRLIEQELKKWNKDLAAKPRLLAVNKCDLGPEAARAFSQIKKSRKKTKIFLISAQTGQGVDKLLDAIIERLQKTEAPGPRRGPGES